MEVSLLIHSSKHADIDVLHDVAEFLQLFLMRRIVLQFRSPRSGNCCSSSSNLKFCTQMSGYGLDERFPARFAHCRTDRDTTRAAIRVETVQIEGNDPNCWINGFTCAIYALWLRFHSSRGRSHWLRP